MFFCSVVEYFIFLILLYFLGSSLEVNDISVQFMHLSMLSPRVLGGTPGNLTFLGKPESNALSPDNY